MLRKSIPFLMSLLVLTGSSFCSAQVQQKELAIQPTVAFGDLKWTGWSPVSDRGIAQALRPIVLTHFGDGSNRIVVATQRGVLHVIANDGKSEATKIFLDIEKRVVYKDKQNEEGLLGMAFHPNYKKNGELFVYYTTTDAPHTSVISRFKVSKNDPNKADPNSEEEIFRIKQPFWNHNGGTIAFGHDGYLYIALGDGGAAKDPHKNGQNLKTLLGSILRIDVDKKSDGKAYGIPKDNPFADKGSEAQPEIYAYGLRNVWRMSFDRETGDFWAADVGQDIWEEINIIVSGGNYGWNLREGKHKFGDKGVDARANLVEPIWEYKHDVGKSITGGHVYRGKKLPGLAGAYLYADYVSGIIWALKYDEKQKKVTSNSTIHPSKKKLAVLSFGEDEMGEVYLLISAPDGKGIYQFSALKK
jgi:glucose/arabinose dehydrogenase